MCCVCSWSVLCVLATVSIEYVFPNSSLVIGWKKLGFPVICWLKLVNWEMHKLLELVGFQLIPAWKTLRKTGIGMRSSPRCFKNYFVSLRNTACRLRRMNFPLPVVKEEDRGLLREVRARRKYENPRQKRSGRTFKSNNNRDSSSNCIATTTVVIGALVVIMTVGFTALEIIHNRNTQITAYPVDPNEARAESTLIQPPPYAGPSMDEIRAELQRSTRHQQMSSQIDQRALIPPDFPEDQDPNTMTDLIGTVFKDTEFHRRFREEGATEWTKKISQSRAIYNESLYGDLPICVQMTNTANGYGYRVWRDAQLHYHSSLMSCAMAVHWGSIGICPPSDGVNMFEFLFYNNVRGFAFNFTR